MCADICIHDKNDGNPHTHIMLTMRPFEPDGSWAAKSKKEYIPDDNGEKIPLKSGEYKSRKVDATDWNEQSKAEVWRQGWATLCNEYLSRNDVAERVDHRSYERQGVAQIPTIHLGVAASAMEKRGIATDRGNINREIAVTNNQLRQLRTRIKKCKDWLYAQPLTDAPTMINVMSHIADGKNLQTRYQKISNLKTQAAVLAFLQNNHITDMVQLVDKVTRMNEQLYDVSGKIKKSERRLSTLAQHLAQYGNYKQHSAVYKKYKELDPKKRDTFRDKHSEGIQSYKDAKQYLDAVMNGRTGLPIKEWKAEQTKLIADKFSLCEEYYRLKDETRSAELLRKGAENIMRGEAREAKQTQAQDMDL